ncbi:trypsin-like serine peptidase [Pseudoduganella guangdongensis]|nr:serine protease [Pseudoduganella guangdongensis]
MQRLETLLKLQPEISSSSFQKLVNAAQEALSCAANNQKLSEAGKFGLEALVRLNGRPAVATKNGNVDLEDPLLASWKERLTPFALDGTLAKRIRSVGRIDRAGKHAGTGFVVGSDLILTNRHVLQAVASPMSSNGPPDRFELDDLDISIDFSDCPDDSNGSDRFRVVEVVGTGSDPIPVVANHRLLDAALLRVEPHLSSQSLPAPIGLLKAPSESAKNRSIALVGYPGRPKQPMLGGKPDLEMIEILSKLYPQYGRRYFSPGTVMSAASGIPGTENFWTFNHDATSLPGNSGSSVIALSGDARAIGLHYAGTARHANYAHATAQLANSVDFLKTGGVVWA